VLRRVFTTRLLTRVALLCLAAWSCAGRELELDAQQVRARYILNFVKYITWPPRDADEGEKFRVMVLDNAPLKSALDAVLLGKTFEGKPAEAVAKSGSGQVLYVRETDRERLSGILSKVGKGTVTIGEGPGFLARGGMIEFNISEGRVRFSVNLPALRQGGFSVDAKLLTAAHEVRK